MPAVAEKPTPTVDEALAAIEALEQRLSRFGSFLDALDELARVSMELGGDEKLGMRPPMGLSAAYFVNALGQEWKELRHAFREAASVRYFRNLSAENGGAE